MQVTATGDTTARAKVVAKYLELWGRTDVAIGVGLANDNKTYTPLYQWAADYDLTKCVWGDETGWVWAVGLPGAVNA